LPPKQEPALLIVILMGLVNYLAFDTIADLAFGKPFGKLLPLTAAWIILTSAAVFRNVI
jgi:hypothetical protein